MRASPLAVVLFVLALAGCGGEEAPERPQADDTAPPVTETTAPEPAETSATPTETGADDQALALRPPGEDGLRVPAKRARIVVKESEFGRVLFDANGQVVYFFELDRRNESNCTSAECVQAWPPVLTQEQPSAGASVAARLLGTIRRGDGNLQVTYNGRPLYFYEHEAPGEIKCHNVNLHGGLWWVVTPRGEPAA